MSVKTEDSPRSQRHTFQNRAHFTFFSFNRELKYVSTYDSKTTQTKNISALKAQNDQSTLGERQDMKALPLRYSTQQLPTMAPV